MGLSGLLQLCQVVQKLRAAHKAEHEGGSLSCPIPHGASLPPVVNVCGPPAVGTIAAPDAPSPSAAVESAGGAPTRSPLTQRQGGQR